MRISPLVLAFTLLVAQTGVAHANPTSLDFTSTAHSAPSPVTSGTVFINEAGRFRGVTPSTMVTPAEAAAVAQVLASSKQGIELSALGNAIGGRFVVPQSLLINNLVVPSHMQVIRDFAGSASLDLLGNFVNSGTFYAVSTDTANTLATIQAANIVNNKNALLTTVLPAGGLAGFGNAISNLSLALVTNSLRNEGIISSAGDLSISAPANSLNINNNYGTIAAVGNISVSAPNAVTLIGGSLNAGNFVNFSAGSALNVYAHDIVGKVSATACDAHVGAATGNLVLGSIIASGDPTFYNVGGSITVTSDTTGGAAITYVAGQDILIDTSAGNVNIATTDANGKGYPVSFIAGANIVGPSGSGILQTGETLKVTGASLTGGDIKITSTNGTLSLDTRGTAAGASAGDVLMVAYSNQAGGNIDLKGSTTFAFSTLGKSGNITMFAPKSISLGISSQGHQPRRRQRSY